MSIDISIYPEPQFKLHPEQVKGFLAADEGLALYRYACAISHLGPVLEVGSYCGKSSLYLGTACQQYNNSLFAIDHHRGSEEHQQGEAYHDETLFDSAQGLVNTFDQFRQTLRQAKLEDCVIPLVAPTSVAAKHWSIDLGMVFIDGGHSFEAALNDYRCWTRHIRPGGVLAIHDLFPNPAEGGQAPISIYRHALASKQFIELEVVNTLGVLQRI